MKKIKILALTTDKGFGGAEKVFNKVNNALLEKFEVHECFFNIDAKEFYESNCKEHHLDVKGSNNILGKITNFLKRILKFRQLVKELKPDIVISHLEGADYVSLLSFTKVKKICVIHGSKYSDTKISGLTGFIRKRIMIPLTYSFATRLITVSKALKEEILAHTNLSSSIIETIYNSTDVKLIQNLATLEMEEQFKTIFDNNDVLIASSRLDQEQKNLKGLIDIFTKLKRDKTVLVIAGDGVDRELLINYTKENDLKVSTVWDKDFRTEDIEVFFIGYQKNPFKYISRSKIFLMTSFYEGFPLSPLEAIACNTPVISSNCPTGPHEILLGEELLNKDDLLKKSYAGALMPIPKDDPSINLWCETIKDILDNKNEIKNKFVENGNERLKMLTPQYINNQWESLIQELVDK